MRITRQTIPWTDASLDQILDAIVENDLVPFRASDPYEDYGDLASARDDCKQLNRFVKPKRAYASFICLTPADENFSEPSRGSRMVELTKIKNGGVSIKVTDT